MRRNDSFDGERFLDTVPPSYELQRGLVAVAVCAIVVFWLGSVVSFRKHPRATVEGIKVTMKSLALTMMLVLFANPHNNFTLRRVFEVPLLTRAECDDLLTIAAQTAARNAELRGNETAELLDEPVGWYKTRDPIYPTTDLHILLDPFTLADRRYLRNLLDERLAPIVARVYGVPTTALRVNDLFFVRYDGGKRVSLVPHTDGSDISFNILLNEEFSGGGTRFSRRSHGEENEGQQHTPFALAQPSPGDCILHGSQVLHEGYPIQSGVRIIIVGFFAVDSRDPFTGASTQLPFLSSWFSISWLQVKIKDAYTFSDRRKEASMSRRNGDLETRDQELAQGFRQFAFNLIKLMGDEFGTHELVRLVEPHNRPLYLSALQKKAEAPKQSTGVNWFQGQHVDIDFSGRIERMWSTRIKDPDLFAFEL